jgi:hypothetical protein
MKRHVLTLVGVLSLLVTAGAAFAQNGVIRVNVPFKFQVNRSALPAGEYSLSPIGGSSQVVLIRGTDKSIMASNANAVESGRQSDRTKLVFRCYGDRYFLSEIWIAGYDRGRQFPKSSLESEVALDTQEHDVILYASLR